MQHIGCLDLETFSFTANNMLATAYLFRTKIAIVIMVVYKLYLFSCLLLCCNENRIIRKGCQNVGTKAVACVPSGASTGKFEALAHV